MFDWALFWTAAVALIAAVGIAGGLFAWINKIQVDAIKGTIVALKDTINGRIDALEKTMKDHEDQGQRNHEANIRRFHDLRDDLSPFYLDVARLKERIFGGDK